MPSLKNIYFIKWKSRYVYGGTQKFKTINEIQNQFRKSVINSETFLMQTSQSADIIYYRGVTAGAWCKKVRIILMQKPEIWRIL